MSPLFHPKRQFRRFAFFSPRALLALLLCGAAGLTVTGTLPAFFHPEAQTEVSQRTLTFAERVAYQRAIEDVYWRHRIWPKENPDPKPSLDAVMSQAQLENKVAGYLRDSLALEDFWQKPITAEQLQAEMDRMARDTKQPGVLRELFEALGNDPAVIAECLARPVLAERLIADFSALNQTPHVDSPQTDVVRTMSMATTLRQVVYSLPKIADAADPPCIDNSWMATSTTNAPTARAGHTAVWTGSEMIVWGASSDSTGGRYNPSTDSWTPTSTTNAPSARGQHTAVWTGSEMIIWGGTDASVEFDTGARYNPATNTWTATSTTNAPTSRNAHTAVWTGNEMIVWGGTDGTVNVFNTGGRYNPSTNSWTATSTTGAPTARASHTAVWTGGEMIIWGGFNSGTRFNTGGTYDPGTDTWTATSTANAPSGRFVHTAVWTGSEMIIWGGEGVGLSLNTGGRYNPSTNSWTTTITANAPDAREVHTAIWTGSEMIVWGGFEQGTTNYFNTGGRYSASTDSWTATSTTNAPSARAWHTAVWTGSEMIIWGAVADNTGGRYCAQSGPTPTPTSTPTPTASPTPTPTPTPCTGRCSPTPRPRQTPAPRPT
jgi:N-acetylneuraminic acid mutarotase